MFFKKISISLIVIFSMISHPISVLAAQVYLGGQSIGINLDYHGVMITGGYNIEVEGNNYNPLNDGYQIGDLIIKVNDSSIESITQLLDEVEKIIQNNKTITLTLQRNNQEFTKRLYFQEKNGKFSTGLYIQDSLSGIGTMTYYDPSTQSFGALGHIMSDASLSEDTIFKDGKIYNSYIKKIIPSKNGSPGSKVGEIGSIEIGQIYENNNYGIYGHYNDLPTRYQKIVETASMDEVEKGEAYFLTVLDGHTIVKCQIEITGLKKQKEPALKGITFRITDKQVLNKTNGIVQGMSGSPIIQNNKLIGCVTHVDVNDVEQGYGLYIDWMLKNNNS